MKLLLRLALLALCGATGVLLAVHLAGGHSASPQALAAAVESMPKKVEETAVVPAAVVQQPVVVQPPSVVRSSPEVRPGPMLAQPQARTAAQLPDLSALGIGGDSLGGGSASPDDLNRALQQATQLLDQVRKQQGGATAAAGTSPAAGGAGSVPVDVLMKVLEQSGQTTQLMQQLQAAQQLGAQGAGGPPVIPGLPPMPRGAVAVPNADVGSLLVPRDATAAPSTTDQQSEAELVPPPPAITEEGDGKLTINARGADVRDLLEQLGEQAGVNILAGDDVQGTVSVNLQNVGVDEAMAAVLKASGFVSRREGAVLYVGTSADFTALEQSLGRIRIRVYRPNYLNAKELSNLFTPLLTPGVGKIAVTSPSGVGIAADTSNAGADSMAQSDAVVIQDYENVLAQIDQVFEELDRRPAQVSIEAVIVSVTLNDKNSYGVDFQLLRNEQNVRFGWGSPRQAPLGGGGQVNPVTGEPLGQFQFDTGGLKFAFLDDSLGVFLNALETVGDANVIASPKLLCLNKQKAEILIGQKLGYINTTVTQTFATQNVEFLEVGAQLRLRPYISSDGLIRMEVHPELSTGQVNTVNGVTLPQKELTEVTTNVMCPDGCTVIIGGLMREDLLSNTTQVPFFGSLPGVGPLFRHKDESIVRTEVLVLLTPRIVYDADGTMDGARGKQETFDMEAAKFHRMSPISRAHLSRDYTGRAYAALSQGNQQHALRFARLAVHYDPLNRDAVRALREIGGNALPLVNHGWGAQVNVGDDLPAPASADGGDVPEWMLDELNGAPPIPLPTHPRESGVPGRSVPILRPEVIGDALR